MSSESPKLAFVPRTVTEAHSYLSGASFSFPERLTASAWLEHAPFAFWLIEALAPQVLVELGTHTGFSYSAFCQAILNLRVGTRAFAVDTWGGDEHAGQYGEEVFAEFKRYHDDRYASFSQLLRTRFEEAADYFEPGSIDLLHIDGQHFYEDVKADFSTWKPKLSDRAVVLFHDTNVRERGFGVYRFWNELRSEFPSFEFIHGHGLGVLGLGSSVPEPVAALFVSSGNRKTEELVRSAYARLGASIKERFLAQHNLGEAAQRVAESEQARGAVLAELRTRDARIAESEQQAREHRIELDALRRQVDELDSQRRLLESQSHAAVRHLEDQRDELRTQYGELSRSLQDAAQREEDVRLELQFIKSELSDSYRDFDAAIEEAAELSLLQTEQSADYKWQRDMVLASLSWRLTKPFRSTFFQALHRPLRSAWHRVKQTTPPQLLLKREADFAAPAAIKAWRKRMSSRPRLQGAGTQVRVVFLSGEWEIPGHTYRIERAAAAASRAGARVARLTAATLENNLNLLVEAQILFVWRMARTETLDKAIALIREHGGTVIYDLDDLMIEPDLADPKSIDGIRTQNLDPGTIAALYRSILEAFVQADVGVAPTDFLAHRMRARGKAVFVLPNGYDEKTLSTSRASVRQRVAAQSDGLIRLGYAAGTRTHQRDFAQIAATVARILHERTNARLVLFRDRDDQMVSLAEYPEFASLSNRIEWRLKVNVAELPGELARFDINLAPLEVGNPFCEAKSELKYFESALVDVPTIASPTEPFRLAIRDGETGFLAGSPAEWYEKINRLLDTPELRKTVGRNAYHDVLWRYGPERRVQLFASLMESTYLQRRAVTVATRAVLGPRAFPLPAIPKHSYLFTRENQKSSDVTVVVPVYNYADFVIEALESVYRQSVRDLDLIVVDDRSTDNSASVISQWLEKYAHRFNRAIFVQNVANSGLAFARNAGFANAETPFVLPLDADNRLRPDCAQRCADTLAASNAAFAYPEIQQFGTQNSVMGQLDFDPSLLVANNFIDAMALIRKSAWAGVGGYEPMSGWEDYDFWCKCVELGLTGKRVPEILAEYRVHDQSMLATVTNLPAKKVAVIDEMERRHPWLRVQRPGT